MRLLALDATLASCSVACLDGDQVVARASDAGERGQSALLPGLVGRTLNPLGWGASIGMVAVGMGPGSFTGLRAAIALATGIARACGAGLIGVTVGQALRAACSGPRPVWVAIDSRRGHVHLDTDGSIASLALANLPRPDGPVAIAGDAAPAVASWLAASGADVQLTGWRAPDALLVARAALAGLGSEGALPVYVDPPAIGPRAAA